MAPPRKTVDDYESEATVYDGCLLHPSHQAARKIYKLRHGPLATFQYVCHTCDRNECILDAHHFVGSPKDNTQDAVRKGRHSGFRKGGTRFSGGHTKEARAKIGVAVTKRWEDWRREHKS